MSQKPKEVTIIFSFVKVVDKIPLVSKVSDFVVDDYDACIDNDLDVAVDNNDV